MTQLEHRWYMRSPDQEKHAHRNNHIKLLKSRPFKNIELFSNKQIKWKSGRNENGQIFLAFAVRNWSLDPWLKWNEVQCLHSMPWSEQWRSFMCNKNNDGNDDLNM